MNWAYEHSDWTCSGVWGIPAASLGGRIVDCNDLKDQTTLFLLVFSLVFSQLILAALFAKIRLHEKNCQIEGSAGPERNKFFRNSFYSFKTNGVCVCASARAGVVEVSDSWEKSQRLGLLFGLGCSALQLSPSQQIVIEQLLLQKRLLCPLVKAHR